MNEFKVDNEGFYSIELDSGRIIRERRFCDAKASYDQAMLDQAKEDAGEIQPLGFGEWDIPAFFLTTPLPSSNPV